MVPGPRQGVIAMVQTDTRTRDNLNGRVGTRRGEPPTGSGFGGAGRALSSPRTHMNAGYARNCTLIPKVYRAAASPIIPKNRPIDFFPYALATELYYNFVN
jgi:hypothetical protein